jgi:hypothetical protein
MKPFFFLIFFLIQAPLSSFSQPDTEPPVPVYRITCCGETCDTADYKLSPYVTDMPDDDKVRSNLIIPIFNKTESYNYEFSCDEIIPGQTRTAKWDVKIIDPHYDARAIITFRDFAGNDTTITIIYWAFKISVTPKLRTFMVKLGESATQEFILKNESEGGSPVLKTLNLKSILEKQIPTGFEISSSFNLNEVIAPQESRTFSVTFKATEIGTFKDSIAVGDSCHNEYRTLLIGMVTKGTSVSESIKKDFLISPNPASDYILIDTPSIKSGLGGVLQPIKIYNIFGENVLPVETGLRPVSTRIDISSLPEGIYFVRIGAKIGKFVVLR